MLKNMQIWGVVRPTEIINLEEKVVDKTGEMMMIRMKRCINSIEHTNYKMPVEI